jgi:hypothetical protein
MEAVYSAGTYVTTYKTKRYDKPQDLCENIEVDRSESVLFRAATVWETSTSGQVVMVVKMMTVTAMDTRPACGRSPLTAQLMMVKTHIMTKAVLLPSPLLSATELKTPTPEW